MFFFASMCWHTRGALVTGVQTCALPISALVFLALTLVVPVDPFWVHSAVLFAACPVGANVYVFAAHYSVQVTAASAAILVSTGLALLTITAMLLFYHPPLPL